MGMCVIIMVKLLKGVNGLRFVIDREECFSHKVQYEGDTVHYSYVVIKADSTWHADNDNAVDLVVCFFLFLNLF